MSIEKVKAYLREFGLADRVREFSVSSATVELAAQALGCEPGRIAKSLSFLTDAGPILIIAEGDARVDNKKFKAQFHQKAKMIPWDEVETYIGHAPGGVCPFAVNDGVAVYLDESLKHYDVVYPAAGNASSAVKLTIAELERCAQAAGWVDVCREKTENLASE
ncbi:MAG: YbaK/EbsC family protein [Clostridiales bacterium]|nr:YbaK/EbsC family protein [Clostridiales bacterium]